MLSFELFLMIENHIRSFFSREERNLSLGKCIEWTRVVAVTCYSCHAVNAFLTSRYQKRQKWACYLAPHSLETSNGPHPCHFDTFTKVINDGLTAKRKLKMKTRYLIQLMPQLIMFFFFVCFTRLSWLYWLLLLSMPSKNNNSCYTCWNFLPFRGFRRRRVVYYLNVLLSVSVNNDGSRRRRRKHDEKKESLKAQKSA